jgi:hypothetical protein
MFPRVRSANLERRSFILPEDFEGEHNLILIAFTREQQVEIDTWIPAARRLARDRTGFRYYELPTISRSIPFARLWLDGAMRAGIPDRAARESTITLYVDKRAFRAALKLPSEDTIYALLVDRAGHVLWRAEGVITQEKERALQRALDE